MEELSASKPKTERKGLRPKPGSEFDLGAWIAEHGVRVKREGHWLQGGYRWVLEECPWNGHGDNSAYIVRFPDGAIAAGCHHDSCHGFGWRDLRKHHEPGAYERRYERNGHERNGTAAAEGKYGVLLSEVTPERVEWEWEGRIARGKLNLMDGDPGTGKSAAATDMAARVTVGKTWPDGGIARPAGW